jgi:hypothetical protein
MEEIMSNPVDEHSVSEGGDHRRPAQEGACRRISRRWHQRRPGPEGRRRRHIKGKRRRHRQGICGHRLAREEPGSAR